MVFSCESCGAQYKISDDKVTGNGVRVKCKKCGSTIVVRPAGVPATPPAPPPPEPVAAPKPPAPPPPEEARTPEERPTQVAGDAGVFSGLLQQSGTPKEPPAQQPSPPPADEQEVDREQTRVFSMDDMARISGERVKAFSESAQPSGPSYFQTFNAPAPQQQSAPEPAQPPKPKGEWYVAIGAVQVGPLTLPEVEERWQKGEINSGTLVWKPGFPDWLQLSGIPELEHLKPKELPPELPPVSPAPVAQAATEEPAAPVEEPSPKADTFSLDDLVSASSTVPEEGPAGVEGTYDAAKVRALATQKAKLEVEITVQQTRIHSEMYQLLTSDQQAKVKELEANREARMQQHMQDGPPPPPSE